MNKRIKGFRILIVDDSKLNLKYYKLIFKHPKYIIEVALSGEEGLEKADVFNPDLIISDVVMPGMDGFAFCKEIRKDPKFKSTIFLLSSSNKTKVKDAVKGLEGGADDYLLKPLDEEQTVAKVDAFLRIKLLQDDLINSNKKLNDTINELEKNKEILEESNKTYLKEKNLLKNSLKEISFLMGELEESHIHYISLNRTLKKNFDDLVTLLATIIELRNPYHKGHYQEVAEISKFIATEFGLQEEEIKDIEIAALLHEIGMIGIPDRILRKSPSEYNKEEQRVISQHSLVGESLLKGYSGLEKAAQIIRHIYEKIDGSGYPDGLAGEEIPMGSRIIKVAAQFNKMTYKSSDTGAIYKVVASLVKHADTEYDGHVVKYLKEYVDSYADRRGNRRTKRINILDLKEGMVLSEDVYTSTGIKLVPKGTKLTDSTINCILNYNKTDPLDKGISIHMV